MASDAAPGPLSDPVHRRRLLQGAGAATVANIGASAARAQRKPKAASAAGQNNGAKPIRSRMIGYMLAHEQFRIPELLDIGERAAAGGFDLLATSDHFQPWQANESHVGEASVTLGALGVISRHCPRKRKRQSSKRIQLRPVITGLPRFRTTRSVQAAATQRCS